jgi:hypothetical protein
MKNVHALHANAYMHEHIYVYIHSAGSEPRVFILSPDRLASPAAKLVSFDCAKVSACIVS